MRAIMIMFDSLNRHMLRPYGSEEALTPNFRRLAEATVTFDRFYAGSMPCMPARRELHTGRHNFLHRSWGPLEPWDDSMPEILTRAGVHTHLVSDHLHYWEDGGATYHPRYSTWEFFRGQNGDPWKGHVDAPGVPGAGVRSAAQRQDAVNRQYLIREEDHPQTRTFAGGVEFIERNALADNWFLQIECFDPHEPFFTYDEYRALHPHVYNGPEFDWPPYQRVTEPIDQVEHARYEYKALLEMCDRSLGRVLDTMDRCAMWDDTLLIVNTDHGFLLGEQGWWGKSVQPWFDELVHLPAFLWDPRTREKGTRSMQLARTIDIAPTLLDFFDQEIPPDMQGRSLSGATDSGAPAGALFGIHGGHVNVTDGRYVYMRACVDPENAPLEEYTLMPTHMRSRFVPGELVDADLAEPFAFTKGVRPMRTNGRTLFNPYRFGTLLYDLQSDPEQKRPLDDPEIELQMVNLLLGLMRDNDAPESQYVRLGLPFVGAPDRSHLLVARQRRIANAAAQQLPPIAELPRGRFGVDTTIRVLLADPASRSIVHQHLPMLADTEILGLAGGVTLYQAAASAMIAPPQLQAIATALANI
ncbi:sulfatase [Gordonia malaquae]|uniref:sulfatase n=1 Tax=Gordonia malaquae TaxID=410332 RepID=UPI0030FF2201